jgi:hypothetical protein
MVWIGFDLDFDPLFVEDFFETEHEELFVFFDFGILEVDGLLVVVFFGFGLRAEANEG